MTAPNGTDWTVRVVWEPRWRALARRFGGWRRKRREKREFDLPDGVDAVGEITSAAGRSPGPRGGGSGDGVGTGGGGGGGGIGGGGGGGGLGNLDFGEATLVIVGLLLAFILAAVLFWWLLLPLLLLLLDIVVVVILLLVAIVARVLFRRPWTVEARSAAGESVTAEVVGWRAALRRRDELADELRRGMRPAAVTA